MPKPSTTRTWLPPPKVENTNAPLCASIVAPSAPARPAMKAASTVLISTGISVATAAFWLYLLRALGY